MIIDRLVPQIESLARAGYGWEDIVFLLRIDRGDGRFIKHIVWSVHENKTTHVAHVDAQQTQEHQ